MDQTEFGMPSREYYLKDRNGTTLLAYETMLIDLAVALGADEGTAEQDAKDIVDFERELAKVESIFFADSYICCSTSAFQLQI